VLWHSHNNYVSLKTLGLVFSLVEQVITVAGEGCFYPMSKATRTASEV